MRVVEKVASLLGVALAWAACSPASPAREERAAPATAHEERSEPNADAPAVEEAPAPAGVVLTGEIGADAVAPVLQNRGAATIELTGVLQIEREGRSGFSGLGDEVLALRASCEAPVPPACLVLVPGAELRPPAWRGPAGRAQCGAASVPEVEPGRYRFVARSCAGGARIEGEPFDLPR